MRGQHGYHGEQPIRHQPIHHLTLFHISHIPPFVVPDEITPLSVIGLLERIKRSANLSAGTKAELDETLTTMQRHYYTAGIDAPTPDLARVARDWVVKMASGTR